MRTLFAAVPVVAMIALAVSGCGSDDDSSESSATTTEATAVNPELGEYCNRAAGYLDATNVDVTDVASILDGFEEAAAAARAVAEVAPAEVRSAHERLADGADERGTRSWVRGQSAGNR